MGMSMVNVELNDCEIQCLENEHKYLGPCHFPVPRGSWQKPSSFPMISSIPHPCSPALLLLSHQMLLQTWGLALALLNSWTICLNPLFWKVFGFFYQRYWLISKYYSKHLGVEMIMFKESQCHLSINWSYDCHRAGKICTGLAYDGMCVRIKSVLGLSVWKIQKLWTRFLQELSFPPFKPLPPQNLISFLKSRQPSCSPPFINASFT